LYDLDGDALDRRRSAPVSIERLEHRADVHLVVDKAIRS
jgi:hypothetical protein